MSKRLGVEQQVLHAYVAFQNLARGRSINEIADELDLSRFAVSRMVKRARDLGLVEVSVHIDEPIDIELSGMLAERFGLRTALVVHTPVSVDTARAAVAAIAARYLSENIVEDDVLGISPGRTLVAASRLVKRLPWVDLVQLTGVGAERLEDGVEAVTNLGRVAGGATYALYAPFLTPSASQLVAQHPALQQAIRRFSYVTKAVLTIGGWPDESLLAKQLRQFGELESIRAQGVVGEFGAVLLDADGRGVPALEDRLIGIDEDSLRAVPVKVAVGGGAGKAAAVLAVLRSGLCDIMITDVHAARAALEA